MGLYARARGLGGATWVARILALLIPALFALLCASGCAGDGPDGRQDRIVRTGSEAPQVGTGGQLKAEPGPLTLADLRTQPKGSAMAAVMELWFWGQWGSAPNVVAAYHTDVHTSVGAPNIAGAFSQQRDAMVSSHPRIVEVRRTPLGRFVALEVLTTTNPAARESFLLRRQRGRWVIIHDTLLERAVAGYVQTLVQERIDPSASKPSPRAVRTGSAAARNYRSLFLTTPAAK